MWLAWKFVRWQDTRTLPFPGEPDARFPGIETATGSLGQGLSIAIGLALGGRIAGKSYRVFCMLGDGECQAGQVWEAAMSAPRIGHWQG